MSRVRDKADFQFAGEDYTHGSGVKYVANMIQTTDLTASGTITDIHLSDISDLVAPTSGNDGHYLKYDHGTTRFVWGAGGGGGPGGDATITHGADRAGGGGSVGSGGTPLEGQDAVDGTGSGGGANSGRWNPGHSGTMGPGGDGGNGIVIVRYPVS